MKFQIFAKAMSRFLKCMLSLMSYRFQLLIAMRVRDYSSFVIIITLSLSRENCRYIVMPTTAL
jgi:hypothetical protein